MTIGESSPSRNTTREVAVRRRVSQEPLNRPPLPGLRYLGMGAGPGQGG